MKTFTLLSLVTLFLGINFISAQQTLTLSDGTKIDVKGENLGNLAKLNPNTGVQYKSLYMYYTLDNNGLTYMAYEEDMQKNFTMLEIIKASVEQLKNASLSEVFEMEKDQSWGSNYYQLTLNIDSEMAFQRTKYKSVSNPPTNDTTPYLTIYSSDKKLIESLVEKITKVAE